MNADHAQAQRLQRLTPLVQVLAAIGTTAPVRPRPVATAEAGGLVLAADVIATAAQPARPLALQDGWAVDSDLTRDAGPYAPAVVDPRRIDAFMPLPTGTDAVAPFDAVQAQGGSMQIVQPVAAGEGVLPTGGDTQAGAVLRAAGVRLRALDVALLRAAGIVQVTVRRPAIHVVNARPGDAALDAVADFIAAAMRAAGAVAVAGGELDAALRDEAADAVIGIGGTGSGRDDHAVTTLARVGQCVCHGVGLSPGETAAFGRVEARPALLLPGRIDAALSGWLALGRPLLARLAGLTAPDDGATVTLARKVASRVGMAEVVPVRREGESVRPLGSGHLSLQTLAQADGFILVPAESEGYPAGTGVVVRPLP